MRLLQAGRLLTLTGAGGVGKTRLALQTEATLTAFLNTKHLLLVLAVRTVEAQVTHLLSKLELRSRAQLALGVVKHRVS